MSSAGDSPSPQGRQTQSAATAAAARTRGLSAYDPNFEEHLNDHGIYLSGHRYGGQASAPQPGNLDQLRRELTVRRPSLSPSQLPESAYQDFIHKNNEVTDENDAMAMFIPMLCGNADIPNKQNCLFTELKPITNDGAVRPKPDFFDGARLQDLSKEVKGDQHLRELVIPTKHSNVPVAPNLFLEVKGPNGSGAVVRKQACYDGANGARAMQALRDYAGEEPAHDNNAYTGSMTYNDGTLRIFAHHTTAPATEGGRPEYHMTQVRGYDMTDSRETFVQGATAFRNTRDWARRERDNLIQGANARASKEQRAPIHKGLDTVAEE